MMRIMRPVRNPRLNNNRTYFARELGVEVKGVCQCEWAGLDMWGKEDKL